MILLGIRGGATKARSAARGPFACHFRLSP
jgi:hypothetical protein